MDVSTCSGSRFCRGPELFGPGTLLDCEERCSPEWHARFRESGIRRTHLEFGTFRQDTSERKSEGRGNHALKTRSIEVLMFSLCLLALGCGSDKSSSPAPGFSLDRAELRPKDAALYGPRPVRRRRIQRYAERDKRNGVLVLPFCGLVTVLQSAARAAAKRETEIRSARNSVGCYQL